MPERLDVEVFASVVNEIEALPVPDVFDRVSQETLDDAVQEVLDVMETDLLPADAVKESVVGVTETVGSAPACVTLMV